MSTESLPSDALALVESPEAQLAKVAAIREVVLGQNDLEGTYYQYAKLTGLEETLEQYKSTSVAALFEVSLIGREAERKMGRMLMEIPRHPGTRTDITSSDGQTRLYGDVLSGLGLTRDRANRWQQAARCPEAEFRDLEEFYRDATLEEVHLRPITLDLLVSRGKQQMERDELKSYREGRPRRKRSQQWVENSPRIIVLPNAHATPRLGRDQTEVEDEAKRLVAQGIPPAQAVLEAIEKSKALRDGPVSVELALPDLSQDETRYPLNEKWDAGHEDKVQKFRNAILALYEFSKEDRDTIIQLFSDSADMDDMPIRQDHISGILRMFDAIGS